MPDEQAVVVGVEELVAGALGAVVVGGACRFTLRRNFGLVVAVEVHLVVDAVGRVASLQLADDVGSPASAQSVGTQSLWLISSLVIVPGLMTPGQRTTHGTRKAPSQFVFFSERNQVMAPSGQRVHVRAVVARVDDDACCSAMPMSSSALSIVPIVSSCSIMPSMYSLSPCL